MNRGSRIIHRLKLTLAPLQDAYRWVRQQVRPILEHVRTRFRLYIWLALIGAAAVGVWSLINFWDWLQTGPGGPESGSTTARNIGLVIAGLVALPLAIWRSLVAQRQAETAQRSLLNERYQQGAEMLGSDVLAVRLGGIYALQRLSEDHPEQYHVQVMQLLCAFVRHPTKDEGMKAYSETREEPRPREDVRGVVTVISARHEKQLELERAEDFKLDLSGAYLAGVGVLRADLSNAILIGTGLSDSMLFFADLSGAFLIGANLAGAHLSGMNLSGASLDRANLSGAKLSIDGAVPARGITQSQLDWARADPNKPPRLDGVVDAETGKPLVWRGKPLDEDG